MITLYIKRHNHTGLRYFGKTVRDAERYAGSGTYWRNHLSTHGPDIVTEWTKTFECQTECTEFAQAFSEIFDIVASDEWANLVDEDGRGGAKPKGYQCAWKGKKRPDHAEKMRHIMSGQNNPMHGREPWNKGMTGISLGPNAMKAHPGKKNGMFGKTHSDEARQKMRDAWIKRKQLKEQLC